MPLLHNIRSLATCRGEGGQAEIHTVERAAMAWEAEQILWVGREDSVPPDYRAMEQVDAGGALVVPGLVDCHTHLAFGGWRADEFELRCRGASYAEIASRGGGILNTVRQTRRMTEGELLERAAGTLFQMARLGVTTVECKSGYGLSIQDELKLLIVYRRLAEKQPVGLVPTFLGAHAVPPEFARRRRDYVALLTEEMIPLVARAGLASFCDIFVEAGAFSTEEARTVLETGRRHGLRPKLHADQLSDGGAAALAAELGAASADHLEHVSEEGIRAMAKAGVVAVNLPLASLYLRQPPMPARRLIEAGVAVAVATDFNPGSAPSYHLPLALTLACTMSGMTPAEALKGATHLAARALDLDGRVGSLERGKQADFVLIDAPDVNHWLYHFRPNAATATYVRGRRLDPARAPET